MSADRDRRRIGRVDLAAVGLVVATAAMGLAALPRLPAEVVVGWHWTARGVLERQTLPRLTGAFVVPAASLCVWFGVRAVGAVLSRREQPRVRRLYDGATLLPLLVLAVGQAVVVAANV